MYILYYIYNLGRVFYCSFKCCHDLIRLILSYGDSSPTLSFVLSVNRHLFFPFSKSSILERSTQPPLLCPPSLTQIRIYLILFQIRSVLFLLPNRITIVSQKINRNPLFSFSLRYSLWLALLKTLVKVSLSLSVKISRSVFLSS